MILVTTREHQGRGADVFITNSGGPILLRIQQDFMQIYNRSEAFFCAYVGTTNPGTRIPRRLIHIAGVKSFGPATIAAPLQDYDLH